MFQGFIHHLISSSAFSAFSLIFAHIAQITCNAPVIHLRNIPRITGKYRYPYLSWLQRQPSQKLSARWAAKQVEKTTIFLSISLLFPKNIPCWLSQAPHTQTSAPSFPALPRHDNLCGYLLLNLIENVNLHLEYVLTFLKYWMWVIEFFHLRMPLMNVDNP